ncbi:hypothetical protein [Lutimonas zeaxanthinifaciens]|uniref:hypothetical protein n=1 Tax=Lutimonas zeaxanthinifaciens TaxID=3060215 RepID=UPI00265CE7EB|nr:hypothetical protein [Lutimonas sp. YSD2104]WKK66034.1 hypothetical protein QZH61_00065 [Lutimonas sp. YSD2104]
MIEKRIFLLIGLFISIHLQGQENHYWFHNFGATSSLKGGIEVAGIRNVAAAYYNPGAMAFIDGEYFEGQADVVSFDALNIKNAGGEMINLDYFSADIAPSLIGYLKRSKKNPKFTYVFGAMTRYNSNLSFLIEHEQEGNYLKPDNERDIFQGQLRYDNRVRESWVMGAMAYKITEKIGVGLGTYIFVRSQDYFSGYFASAFPKSDLESSFPEFSALTSNTEEQKFNARVMGVIFRPAVDVDLDELKLGLSLSTPAISLGLLNNYAYRSQVTYLPDEDIRINSSDSHNKFSGVYKTPFSANFGAEYDFGKLLLAFSLEWFAKIEPYAMIKENDRSISPEFPTAPDSDYAIPVMAHKSVTNFGFSVRYQIKDWISYIGSFRTDKNFFDNEALDRYEEFVPSFTYWDLFHITSGIKMSSKRLNLTVGIDYANGSSEGERQFADMTSASQSNFLKGDIKNNTSTQYHNFSFTLGVNLNIEKDQSRN